MISLWGNINPTDRGDTTRFSLSSRWSEADANSHSRIEAYAIHSTLDLFNDFDLLPVPADTSATSSDSSTAARYWA